MGRVTTATGEQLTMFISDALTSEQATTQQRADFFSRLVHGSEISHRHDLDRNARGCAAEATDRFSVIASAISCRTFAV
jgi:hypothetical protein